jgi:chaperonin GroES
MVCSSHYQFISGTADQQYLKMRMLTTTPQSLTIKSIKSLVPLLDRILVQRVKAETKTAGGIFLPEAAVKELNEAKVLAVGPGAFDRDGKRVAVSVKPGDKVLIPQVCGWWKDENGKSYLLTSNSQARRYGSHWHHMKITRERLTNC